MHIYIHTDTHVFICSKIKHVRPSGSSGPTMSPWSQPRSLGTAWPLKSSGSSLKIQKAHSCAYVYIYIHIYMCVYIYMCSRRCIHTYMCKWSECVDKHMLP